MTLQIFFWLMGGLMGGSGKITKNQINLDLIKIIQFCLKIYDFWRHLHLWMGGWVDGWVDGEGQVKSLNID